MDDKNSKTEKEIDFLSKPSLQVAIKKAKRKQMIKYILIASITTIILLFIVFNGSQYILNKKLDNNESLYDSIHGANISYGNTWYNHDIFSVTAETTYRKNMGDRSILWDKKTEEIPLFGRKKLIERGSGMMEMYALNDKDKREVRYNDFNNERKIDFYYPKLSYDFLPDEIDIVDSLHEHVIIEIALSFKEPMTIDELGSRLGYKNVNWLWADTTTSAQMERMEKELDHDSLKTKGGGGAFGIDVQSETPYSEEINQIFINKLYELDETNQHKGEVREALKGIKEATKSNSKELKYNGAVVTGTKKELQRFQKLDFIRASVLGATIDKY
ncbi:anti sigma factor C-terminal domain-containing protein [Niallia sp. 01092]|uniref:anti sigma factor C-terminal domain-containing protein n=1 Tax=unclassified Niallia TaxID=2837522 RepID=UPI003FCF1729